MTSRLSVRDHRIRYQIWWLIGSTSGECTLQDMVALTGASIEACRSICFWNGWTPEYRRMATAAADSMAGHEDASSAALDLIEAFR